MKDRARFIAVTITMMTCAAVSGAAATITLVPYGSTRIRLTAFPGAPLARGGQ